jgi:hypothetical protein
MTSGKRTVLASPYCRATDFKPRKTVSKTAAERISVLIILTTVARNTGLLVLQRRRASAEIVPSVFAISFR